MILFDYYAKWQNYAILWFMIMTAKHKQSNVLHSHTYNAKNRKSCEMTFRRMNLNVYIISIRLASWPLFTILFIRWICHTNSVNSNIKHDMPLGIIYKHFTLTPRDSFPFTLEMLLKSREDIIFLCNTQMHRWQYKQMSLLVWFVGCFIYFSIRLF